MNQLASLRDASGEDRTAFRRALRVLKDTDGMDFSRYKPEFLITRFLHSSKPLGLDAYLVKLQSDRVERVALEQSFLIGVTNFFRDRSYFDALEQIAVPRILGHFENPIRVWVPGCSTGQEAYSIAMLLDAVLSSSDRGGDLSFRIFATDIDSRALDTAVEGRYLESELEDLPSGQRAQYFEPEGSSDDTSDAQVTWRVKRSLRRHVVFSRHDLLTESPLGGIHLISCRNLLIYLQERGQKHVIDNLRQALLPAGFLGLGPSEFLNWPRGFKVVNRGQRLFERVEGADPSTSSPSEADAESFGQGLDLQNELPEQVIERYVPRGFLLATDGRLIRSFGGAERYLRVRRRRPSDSLLDLLPAELTSSMVRAMQDATWDLERVHFPSIELTAEDGRAKRFDVSVEPIVQAEQLTPDQPNTSSKTDVTAFFLAFVPAQSRTSLLAPLGDHAPERGASGADLLPKERAQRLTQRLATARADRHRLSRELEDTRQSLEQEQQRRQQAEREVESLTDAIVRSEGVRDR